MLHIKHIERITDHELSQIAHDLYLQQEASPHGLGYAMVGDYLENTLSLIKNKYTLSDQDLNRILGIMHKRGAIYAKIDRRTKKVFELQAGAASEAFIQEQYETLRNRVISISAVVIALVSLIVAILSLYFSLRTGTQS